MREILFKGKRIDNGEWVEGFYYERMDTLGKIIEAIIIADAYEQITSGQRYIRSNIGYECFRVDPVTVGQYTGMNDKNEKKIFDGDIVDIGGDLYSCRWDECNLEFGVSNKEESCGMEYLASTCIEVIGNMHDDHLCNKSVV